MPGTENGFSVLPDLQFISVSGVSVAPFSLPEEAFSYEPDPNTIVSFFANGDRERSIHCNIELSLEEQQNLAAVQALSAQRRLSFMPSVSVMATRFLAKTSDPERALQRMQDTQNWRRCFFARGPITDDSVREDLRTGCIYWIGRDCALRPALCVRMGRIPRQWLQGKSERFVRTLVFCVEYFLRYMVLPGRVEGMSIIIDFKGVSTSSLPISALKEVYKTMDSHYVTRVKHIYVLSLPSMLSFLSSAVKMMLSERQRQKVVEIKNVVELRQNFALSQLEEDFGGTRPMLHQFFPFPLVGGPFGAGCDGLDPCQSGMHAALTANGFRGRLWNPKLSRNDNVKLELSCEAEVLLRAEIPGVEASVPCNLQTLYRRPLTPVQEELSVLTDSDASPQLQSGISSHPISREKVMDNFNPLKCGRKNLEIPSSNPGKVCFDENDITPTSLLSCRPCRLKYSADPKEV